MFREALIMTQQPNIAARILLFRYFKDRDIDLESVAEKTGYSVNYLKNLRSGSDPITDAVKFKFLINYPETQNFLMPKGDEGEEAQKPASGN